MDTLPGIELITRRHFLRRLGFATGAVASVSLLRDLDAVANPSRPLQAVIVGAGLAGLVAAHELEKRGQNVVLLEAEPKHVGGRVRTLRFEGGMYGEAGAMRIPLAHKLTRHYIQEFKLPLRKFVQVNPEGFYHLRGRRERIRDVKNLKQLYELKENERDLSPDELWDRAVLSHLKALTDKEKTDLSAETPQTERVRALDRLSMFDLCEKAGLSDEAVELLAVTSGFETLMTSAATEHLRDERDQLWTQEFHEIVGGTDRLPTAFVERLRSKPRMGCRVVQLEQDKDKGRAAAIYIEDGKEQRAEGDFVLCTLPLSVMSRIKITPPLSGPKQRAFRQLSYDSSTKVLAVCNTRFWEKDDGIFGGGTFTDLPTGTTYYPADNAEAKDPKVAAGPGVLLASYTWGMTARRIAAFPHNECCALVSQHLPAVHPQYAKKGVVRETVSWSWDGHPYSGGAFVMFTPGQHSALHRHVISPEGRIYFAGEHASLSHAWMQGALESGLRAVEGMLIAANGRK